MVNSNGVHNLSKLWFTTFSDFLRHVFIFVWLSPRPFLTNTSTHISFPPILTLKMEAEVNTELLDKFNYNVAEPLKQKPLKFIRDFIF
jgi:hypothetical protein